MFDEAIADLEQAARMDPTNVAAYDELVNVYDRYNMFVAPPCVVLPLTGETVCGKINPDPPSALPDRTPVYQGMSASDPNAAWLHGILATFYQQPQVYSPATAATHLECLVGRHPEFPEFHKQLAQLYETLNRPGDAARQWNLYLSQAFKDPNRPQAQASLSHLALIVDPILVQPGNPKVPIHGSANIANFQSYQVDYGVGDQPATWTRIAGPITTPVYDDNLTVWDTTGLASGVYTIRLTAVDTSGMQSLYFLTFTLTK
jgi:hypothetical protein